MGFTSPICCLATATTTAARATYGAPANALMPTELTSKYETTATPDQVVGANNILHR
jgi:hypothetical protein